MLSLSELIFIENISKLNRQKCLFYMQSEPIYCKMVKIEFTHDGKLYGIHFIRKGLIKEHGKDSSFPLKWGNPGRLTQ